MNRKVINTSVLLFLIMSCNYQVSSESPLDIIQPVINRIIDESILELTKAEAVEDNSLQIFDFSEIGRTSDPFILVKSNFEVGYAQQYKFGLSSSSEVRVFINDNLAFHYFPEDSFYFKEAAYGMYEFNKEFETEIFAGRSEIVFECKSDQAVSIFFKELFHPIDGADIKFEEWSFTTSQSGYSTLTAYNELNWGSLPARMQSSFVMNDEMIYKRESYCEWTYPNGIMQMSLINLYELTRKPYLLEYVRSVADFTLANLDILREEYNGKAIRCANYRIFRKSMLDDAGSPVLGMKELYRITKDEKYLPLIDEMVNFVLFEQQRLPDGTFCRPEPFENSVWADDLFMGVMLMLQVAQDTDNWVIFDDCVLQIKSMHNYLWDEENKLHRHGFIGSKNIQTPVCWSRANGWLNWVISDALQKLPKDHPGYNEVLNIYRKSIDGLITRQGPNGLWCQILTDSTSFHETSASAMFTLAIARGIFHGWLPISYNEYADLGWKGVSGKIQDGVVHDISRGTGIGFEEEFYLNRARFPNDPRGLGAVIVCAIEMEKLSRFNCNQAAPAF